MLRRLTHSQYNSTVRDLLGTRRIPPATFPPEDYVNGFKNQYEALSVSPLLAEAYSLAAEKLAANAFRRGDSRGLIPCTPRFGRRCCAAAAKFISTFGRKAFRRPLEREEFARYQADLPRRRKTFLTGAQAVIEAMLQSPTFLFWLEETPNPKWKPYATAARLSYFLWNTTPDEALLDSAAARRARHAGRRRERAARRMLDNPKAREGLDEFVSQWLRFDRVMTASRERRLFPLFSRELGASMTEETRRFVGDLVWNDRNFMDAFTANYSFINSDLAAVYKVPPPARDFERVEFPPESERAGLLGQALFLTLTSKPDDTAPTGRGLFVREQFLCQQVPPPPPGVDTNLPPVEESKPVTNRERLAAHTTNQMCVKLPQPDRSDRFRLREVRRHRHAPRKAQAAVLSRRALATQARRAKPKEVRARHRYQGIRRRYPGLGVPDPRASSAKCWRTRPQCQECVVKQVFRYMAGRLDTPADRPVIRQALDDFPKLRSSGSRS